MNWATQLMVNPRCLDMDGLGSFGSFLLVLRTCGGLPIWFKSHYLDTSLTLSLSLSLSVLLLLLLLTPLAFWPCRALHEVEIRRKGGLTRLQFFLIVLISSFAYYIIPNYLFPSITALSFVCWIWKDSVTAQQIGSGLHGPWHRLIRPGLVNSS